MKKITVYALAGSELTGLQCDYEGRMDELNANELKELKEGLDVFEFDTQAEADAFAQGIEYAAGWMEAYVIDKEQAEEILNA